MGFLRTERRYHRHLLSLGDMAVDTFASVRVGRVRILTVPMIRRAVMSRLDEVRSTCS
jgi:hypothetical protein